MKKKVKINVDNWDTGDWPYDLKECLKFELIDNKSIEIEFDIDALDKVARKIAREALEALLDDCTFMIFLSEDGLLFKPNEENATFPEQWLLPFSELWLPAKEDNNKKVLEAWRGWLNEIEKTESDDN